MTDTLAPEVQDALRRYLAIQQEERRLREEKKALQQILIARLGGPESQTWYPELDGERLRVRFLHSVVIRYDETLLRSRLGARYPMILAPDPYKVRRHLPELAGILEPVLDLVGSPHPDKVRQAVQQRLVTVQQFEGAFTKENRDRVIVSRFQKAAEAGPSAATPAPGA